MAGNFDVISSTVQTQLASVQAGAETYISMANSIITQLSQFVAIEGQSPPTHIEFPSFTPIPFDAAASPDVQKFGALSEYQDVPQPPEMEQVEQISDFTAEPPNIDFNWEEQDYQSSIKSAIENRISNLLSNDATLIGFNKSVENAIYVRARSRTDSDILAANQQAFDTFASRGFSMPPGVLVAQVNAATEKGMESMNAANRDIVEQSSKLAIDAAKSAIEVGTQWEKITSDRFENKTKRRWDLFKLQIDLDIQLFTISADIYKLNLSAYTTKVSGVTEIAKANIERYTASVNAAKAKVEAQANAITATAKAYEADVSRYDAENKLKTSVNETNIKLAEDRLRSTVAYYEISIKEFDISISRLIEQAKVHMSALDAAGRMATQMAAGFTSAVHIQASLHGQASTTFGQEERIDWSGEVSRDAPEF